MIGPTSNPVQGDLFPDFSQLVPNRWEEGRAFRLLVESRGVGVQGAALEFDAAAWEAARQRPGFDDDYRLSVAKLLLQIAVKLHC